MGLRITIVVSMVLAVVGEPNGVNSRDTEAFVEASCRTDVLVGSSYPLT